MNKMTSHWISCFFDGNVTGKVPIVLGSQHYRHLIYGKVAKKKDESHIIAPVCFLVYTYTLHQSMFVQLRPEFLDAGNILRKTC
nr:hypothetical protein BN993_06292 [Virgibacillus halodenitrificans]